MPRRFGRRGKWAKLKSQTQSGNRLRRAAAHGLNEYVNFAVAIFTVVYHEIKPTTPQTAAIRFIFRISLLHTARTRD
jgi:predicted membrane channel-forming protein YqfA (hemolysin III family)